MAKNLIGLIDACCDALENPLFMPSGIVTHCNQALNAIAVKAFGVHDFDGLTADQILQFMSGSDLYTEIPMAQAQSLANDGSLVIAAASSQMLGQEHGHVCVIRPGREKDSGKWGICPSVLNIGTEIFTARAKKGPLVGMPAGLNEAFVPMPRLFVWRGSI